MKVFVESVALLGPGMPGWHESLPVLRGERPLVIEPLPPLKPKILPAAMLRRTTRHIRMAIEVASQTVANTRRDGLEFASVFAASENDAEITDEICRIVVSDERFVAASSFNNSVSNAAVGTWSIALKSQQPTTCVTGYDYTFCVGLLEAACQVVAEQRNVLLVAHDVIGDEPLWSLRPLLHDFGVGLLLTPGASEFSLAQLEIELLHDALAETTLELAELEAVRRDNPAARSLPILQLLAGGAEGAEGEVILSYHDDSFVQVTVKNVPTDA